jgi:hypothetical protein
MATKTFYATRDMKHPTYRTRMLRAGDELELDGPTARLFERLGAISPTKPKGAKVAEPAPAPRPVDGQGTFSDEVEAAPRGKTAAKPRKRAAKKRATAKK